MLEGRCAPCHDTNFQVLPCCGELHGCEANLYVLEILFNFSKKIDCGPLDCVDHVFSGPTDFNTWACCCGFGFCYDCRLSYFLLHCKISRFHAFWFYFAFCLFPGFVPHMSSVIQSVSLCGWPLLFLNWFRYRLFCYSQLFKFYCLLHYKE